MTKPKRKSTNYLDNKKFYEALKEYHAEYKRRKEAGLDKPNPSPYIVQCLYLIAVNLGKAGSFAGYSYVDEMVSDALENLIKYVHVFDPARGNNPHAFFTRAAKNAFIRRMDIEKLQQHVKNKIRMNNITNSDPYDDDDGDEDGDNRKNAQLDDLYSISTQITEFERRLEEKKQKRKKPNDDTG